MNDSDLIRLRSLLNSVSRITIGEIRTEDGSALEATDNYLKLYRRKADQILLAPTYQQLVQSYQPTAAERGDICSKTLLTEIKRRNLYI